MSLAVKFAYDAHPVSLLLVTWALSILGFGFAMHIFEVGIPVAPLLRVSTVRSCKLQILTRCTRALHQFIALQSSACVRVTA